MGERSFRGCSQATARWLLQIEPNPRLPRVKQIIARKVIHFAAKQINRYEAYAVNSRARLSPRSYLNFRQIFVFTAFYFVSSSLYYPLCSLTRTFYSFSRVPSPRICRRLLDALSDFFYPIPYLTFILSGGVIRFSLKNRFDPSGTSLSVGVPSSLRARRGPLERVYREFNEWK